MSVPMIPVALPINASDEAIRDLIGNDGGFSDQFGSIGWTVPAGECWLVETLFADTQLTSGGVQFVRMHIDNGDNAKIVDLMTDNSFTTGTDPTVQAGLYYPFHSFVHVVGDGASVAMFPLPMVIGLPGWSYSLDLTRAQSGSDFFEGIGWAMVTKWELGGHPRSTLEAPVVTPKIP